MVPLSLLEDSSAAEYTSAQHCICRFSIGAPVAFANDAANFGTLRVGWDAFARRRNSQTIFVVHSKRSGRKLQLALEPLERARVRAPVASAPALALVLLGPLGLPSNPSWAQRALERGRLVSSGCRHRRHHQRHRPTNLPRLRKPRRHRCRWSAAPPPPPPKISSKSRRSFCTPDEGGAVVPLPLTAEHPNYRRRLKTFGGRPVFFVQVVVVHIKACRSAQRGDSFIFASSRTGICSTTSGFTEPHSGLSKFVYSTERCCSSSTIEC